MVTIYTWFEQKLTVRVEICWEHKKSYFAFRINPGYKKRRGEGGKRRVPCVGSKLGFKYGGKLSSPQCLPLHFSGVEARMRVTVFQVNYHCD